MEIPITLLGALLPFGSLWFAAIFAQFKSGLLRIDTHPLGQT